ncbi:hypothetical protein Hanom_Chr08g00723201 [Helianthus anomalus]
MSHPLLSQPHHHHHQQTNAVAAATTITTFKLHLASYTSDHSFIQHTLFIFIDFITLNPITSSIFNGILYSTNFTLNSTLIFPKV